jgi:hypothetical protein
MLYDVFICHASEDKIPFVDDLARKLRDENVEVWYDDFVLSIGDSIRRSIDKGLRHSRFGIVVLSQSFFAKNWPQYELDALVELEMAGNDKVILPIWHETNHVEVAKWTGPRQLARWYPMKLNGIDGAFPSLQRTAVQMLAASV